MLAFGATLGGIATQYLGVRQAFVIDGVTFMASIIFFLRLPSLPPPERDSGSARFVDGLRYLARSPYILCLTVVKPLMGIIGGVIVLIPFFGTDAFAANSGPLWIGTLYGFRGAGAAVGALVVRLVVGDSKRTMRRVIVVGFLLASVSYLGLSVSHSFWATCVAYFFATIGTSTIWVFSGTLMQLETDKEFHGRVFAIQFGVLTLMMAGSSWLAGYALDHGYDLWDVAQFAGGLALVPATFWTASLLILRSRMQTRAPGTATGQVEVRRSDGH